MSKKSRQEYLDAMDHWMVTVERDRLETRVKRLLTARNKWRKRARVAEARVVDAQSAIAQAHISRQLDK